jgi:pseudaminic acid biosynthesis-associated methylase
VETSQTTQWLGEFGRAYTDRNLLDLKELDALHARNYGVTRTELNQRFLAAIPPTARILEVGCNLGNQLLLLQHMGFCSLHGIEIQPYALERARSRVPQARLQQASAFEIPYPDAYFDLVFTSGVLIHIAPPDLPNAFTEIHRCSGAYIWGLEYYAPEVTEVVYRGHEDLLWKMDYAKLYLEQFPDLKQVQKETLPYLENSNVDCMFLLRKTWSAA